MRTCHRPFTRYIPIESSYIESSCIEDAMLKILS